MSALRKKTVEPAAAAAAAAVVPQVPSLRPKVGVCVRARVAGF